MANNQIRAPRVRVVDESGKQLGVMNTAEALQIARERNLDLVQVTERVDPPVCKIIDVGKYLYAEQKKHKETKKQAGQLKQIRISFTISVHDLEIKAQQAEKFLKRGDRVLVGMRLRGRERSLREFAKEKMNRFLEVLQGLIPIKLEREIKLEPRGLTTIITKA